MLQFSLVCEDFEHLASFHTHGLHIAQMHKHNIGPGSTRWWENPTGMLEVSERLSAARLSPARPTSHLFVHPPWFEDCALHIPATP